MDTKTIVAWHIDKNSGDGGAAEKLTGTST